MIVRSNKLWNWMTFVAIMLITFLRFLALVEVLLTFISFCLVLTSLVKVPPWVLVHVPLRPPLSPRAWHHPLEWEPGRIHCPLEALRSRWFLFLVMIATRASVMSLMKKWHHLIQRCHFLTGTLTIVWIDTKMILLYIICECIEF